MGTAAYHSLQAGAENKVYYLKAPSGSNPFTSGEGHELYAYNLEERKEEELADRVTAYVLTPSGEKMLYLGGQSWFIVDAGPLLNPLSIRSNSSHSISTPVYENR